MRTTFWFKSTIITIFIFISEPKTTANPDKCLVDDLPAYKSPMTIEIIGPEDSIKNVVAEIEKFEKCPRQSLAASIFSFL